MPSLRMTLALHPRLRDATAIAVVLAATVGIWWAVAALAALLFGADYGFPSHVFRAVATTVLVIPMLFAATRWTRAAGGPPAGLRPDRQSLSDVGLGALAYLAPFLIASVLVLNLSTSSLTLEGSPLDALGELAAVLALVLLYEAIPEELIFRGAIFSFVRRHLSAWATVVIQAALFCLFGVLIGAATTPDRLILFALFALSIGVVRAASGSVFAAIGFHAAFQTATQPVLGSQWTALTLDDPERWYSDIAYGLAPLVLGPLLVVAIVRWRRRRS